jgi:RNA polymerase II subunit A C-terminal domain phosphatase
MNYSDINLSDNSNEKAAPRIQMLPGKSMLAVSMEEAARVEEEASMRLKQQKKLSLVVDLDQTLLHASMEPCIAEWIKSSAHPFHEAARHIKTLHLADNPMIPYYVHFRNGLNAFLEAITPFFELHVYTMGTWAYADAILKCIDPESRYFHDDRIMTRDRYLQETHECMNGSESVLPNWTKKHLKRLFPCKDNMVLILDDRADVWENSPNLIRIKPYEFFKGYGDVNDPWKLASGTIPQHEHSSFNIYPNSVEAERQDRQLAVVQEILIDVHTTFYRNLALEPRSIHEIDTKVPLLSV